MVVPGSRHSVRAAGGAVMLVLGLAFLTLYVVICWSFGSDRQGD